MAVVFVSHAFADKSLVDEFVDTILRNGCGLEAREIFYTSGEDTGVPDGTDLLAHVRDKVEETGLVVAMLTPTFQTRPVCVAELGAAWARTGKLFPLLVPGMKRSELEGVLSTQLVESMDNAAALDRLHDRIVKVTSRPVDAATWTRFKEKWLRRLREIQDAGQIPTPTVVTKEDYEAAVKRGDDLAGALGSLEAEYDRLRAERDAIAELKDREQVRNALLPTEDVERFQALAQNARIKLGAVDSGYVADAIVASFSDKRGLAVPKDDWDRDQVYELAENGKLVDYGEGIYTASEDFVSHVEAEGAVGEAIKSVADDNPDFVDWFMSEYDMRPNMRNYSVLHRVFLDKSLHLR